ncbi:MAG TPA: signal peptidase II, partial [Acidimicrobiales bacterium]
WMAAGLGLVLGGAVGNLADRLFRDHGGAVVDFVDLQWWPVFNVADIAISVGAVLLVVVGWREQTPDAAAAEHA